MNDKSALKGIGRGQTLFRSTRNKKLWRATISHVIKGGGIQRKKNLFPFDALCNTLSLCPDESGKKQFFRNWLLHEFIRQVYGYFSTKITVIFFSAPDDFLSGQEKKKVFRDLGVYWLKSPETSRLSNEFNEDINSRINFLRKNIKN